MVMLVTHSVTNSLTHSLLFSKLESDHCLPTKLVEVDTVVEVDDEDRIGNSLLQIWKLRFGYKVKLLFRL